MKKLINDPANYVDEALDGLTLAFPSLVRDGAAGRVIRRAEGVAQGRVGIASGVVVLATCRYSRDMLARA
jgi:dihydroxyacetone kinase-like protein